MSNISEILDLAGQQLEDLTHITWDATAVLLPYANLGILEILNLKPDAYPTTENLSLVAGTIQSLPTTAIYLIDINCNMGADGSTPGRSIIKIEKEILDKVLPFWNMTLTTNEVLHVIFDADTPNIFYVFPPQSQDTKQEIELIWQSFPLPLNVELVGGTEQELATSLGIRVLLDLVRNMGANGGTIGKAIRKIQRPNLERLLPDFHTYTATTEVSFGMIDPLTPKRFYVFPPQPDNTTQEIEVIGDPYPIKDNVSLVQGPKQSLPQTAKVLVDAVRNMGTDGKTAGRYITKIDKKIIDAVIPGWLDYAASGEVQFYLYDKFNPQKFYVFPPQLVNGRNVRAIVSIPPTWLTATTNSFPLDASYKPALVDYIIYRALAESTTIPNALAKATLFWNKFLQDLGLKTNVEKQIDLEQDGLRTPSPAPQTPPPKGG